MNNGRKTASNFGGEAANRRVVGVAGANFVLTADLGKLSTRGAVKPVGLGR